MKNYYDILGVENTATEIEIKKAYKKLALEFHPDRNSSPDAEDRFKEISEAYSILSDPKKRNQYDNSGFSGNFEDFFGGFNPFGGGGMPIDLMDFIKNVGFSNYSNNTEQKTNVPGEKIDLVLELELEDALDVSKKEIQINRKICCTDCKGSGADINSKNAYGTCDMCGGRGQIHKAHGPFMLSQTCGKCSGQGKMLVKNCKTCKGYRFSYKEEKLEIKIPAGIDHGHTMRIKGKGHEGVNSNHISGDLFIHIEIKKHEKFMRNENNLYLEQKIPYTLAVLGGKFNLPVLSRNKNEITEVTLPSGLNDEQVIEFPNLGFPSISNKNVKGSQIVKFSIDVPKFSKLNKEQIEIIQKLHKIL